MKREKKMRSFGFAVVFCMLAVGVASAQTSSRVVPQSTAQMQVSFSPIVAKAAPAVVNVYARRVVSSSPFSGDPLFNQFFGGSPLRNRVEQSLGSGVIVRSDGIIITNNHVIENGQNIKVALNDRREFEAKIILADKRTDLAVLKIDTKGEKLPALEFGDSDAVQVGDLVLAIGDPFGVGQTVTSGIVSALARNDVGASDYQFFIQTDAAINPGNSGGALVTMDGKLAGINSSIISSSGGSVGIGFAIPANMAKLVVQGALGGGIKRPWFGADGQAVTSDLAKGLGLSRPQGVLVNQIYSGGPAARAGIAKGDVILSMDGFAVDDPQTLRYRVATHTAGSTIRTEVVRMGAKRTLNVAVTLPPDEGRNETNIAGVNPMQGAKVANVTPALADEMQLDFNLRGVVVVSVDDGSQAGRFGFQPGDLVRQINGATIGDVASLRKALDGAQSWQMVVQRGDRTINFSVR
jgi:serine protease Do